jgi:hypothetical protein
MELELALGEARGKFTTARREVEVLERQIEEASEVAQRADQRLQRLQADWSIERDTLKV